MKRWLTYTLVLALAAAIVLCLNHRYRQPLAAYTRVQPGMTLDRVKEELGPCDVGVGGLWHCSYLWVRPGCRIQVDFEVEKGVRRVRKKRIEYSHAATLQWLAP